MQPPVHPLAAKVVPLIDGPVVAAAAFNPNVLLGTPGAGLASLVAVVNWRRKVKARRRSAVVTDQTSLVVVTPTTVYLYDLGLLRFVNQTTPVVAWARAGLVATAVELVHPYDPSGRPDPRRWPALRLTDTKGALLTELQPESWAPESQKVYLELTGVPGWPPPP